jgi:hypothetical protein
MAPEITLQPAWDGSPQHLTQYLTTALIGSAAANDVDEDDGKTNALIGNVPIIGSAGAYAIPVPAAPLTAADVVNTIADMTHDMSWLDALDTLYAIGYGLPKNVATVGELIDELRAKLGLPPLPASPSSPPPPPGYHSSFENGDEQAIFTFLSSISTPPEDKLPSPPGDSYSDDGYDLHGYDEFQPPVQPAPAISIAAPPLAQPATTYAAPPPPPPPAQPATTPAAPPPPQPAAPWQQAGHRRSRRPPPPQQAATRPPATATSTAAPPPPQPAAPRSAWQPITSQERPLPPSVWPTMPGRFSPLDDEG